MELDDALGQIDKLEQQVQVACKAGGDEVLHTVMEIRANPYEDLDEGDVHIQDRTVTANATPYDQDNDLGGNLSKLASNKRPATGMQRSNLAASQDKLNIQGGGGHGNMKMNLGLHNKGIGGARDKKKIENMGIPSLDLSGLKNVKEFKDWYGYSQKLENAIRLLREKNEALEKDCDMRELHMMKLDKQVETLQGQVKSYQ